MNTINVPASLVEETPNNYELGEKIRKMYNNMETKQTNNLFISTDSKRLTMEGSGLVQINTTIKIHGTGTELPIKIIADFNNIPHHLHQTYLQALMYQYNTSVGVYDNTK